MLRLPRIVLALASLAASLTAGCRPEADRDPAGEVGQFLRFVEDEQGNARLETAIVRYSDPAGREVDLVAAVHIADADCFRALNRWFERYDALLYELVAEKDARPEPDHDSPVSRIQRAFKDLLGLEFQLDLVDYSAENFVHADLEPREFMRLMEERGESLWTLMLQAALTEMRRAAAREGDAAASGLSAPGGELAVLLSFFSKDRARTLKRLLGRQFGDIEAMAAGLEKGLRGGDSVLLVERNKAALAVLQEQLDAGDQRIGIYYGAAHLPDLERRLLADFGMKRVEERWLTAWDVPRS